MQGYRFSWKSAEPEFISKALIKDQKTVLEVAKKKKKAIMERLKNSCDHSIAYCEAMENLLNNFIAKVAVNPIMTITDPWWGYSIEMESNKIELFLYRIDRISFVIRKDNKIICKRRKGGNYSICKCSCKKLTVEEYADKYGVKPVTVRQWIRRGKLRSAEKIGSEWKIPELSDIPKRGYLPGHYYLNENCTEELPEEYQYLAKSCLIMIMQSFTNRNIYNVYCFSEKGDYEKIQMNEREREKLELFLISTSYFNYMFSGKKEYSTVDGRSLETYLNEELKEEDLKDYTPYVGSELDFIRNLVLDGSGFSEDGELDVLGED